LKKKKKLWIQIKIRIRIQGLQKANPDPGTVILRIQIRNPALDKHTLLNNGERSGNAYITLDLWIRVGFLRNGHPIP